MRFPDDGLHIHVLNKPQDFSLPSELDPNDQNVVTAISTGETEEAFECAGLGRVEMRATVYASCAFLGLKIQNQSIAAAELVWESFVSEKAWAGINQFHQAVSNGNTSARSKPPQMCPWLAIAFLHPIYDQLTPEQRRTVIVLLCARAQFIREQARGCVILN